MCISTKNVGLLPWVVCASGISSYVDGGSSTRHRSLLLWWSTSMNVELWTAGIWFPVRCQTEKQFSSENFSVTRWTPSSRQFYCSRCEMLLFQPLLMQHFSSSVYLGNLHPSSSFATWSTNTRHFSIRPAKNFYIWTSAEALSGDWQYFESTSRNCLTLWTEAEALCRD